MILKKIKTKNYRSLEDIEIHFNPFYNAISGKNNSGKSNIIRAVLTFLTYDFRFFRENLMDSDIHYASDYPYWKKKGKDKEEIKIELELELNPETDTGIFKFIKELIFKEEDNFDSEKEILKIIAIQKADTTATNVAVYFGNKEIDDEYKRDELLNRLRSSKSVLFHNSTENAPAFFSRRSRDSVVGYVDKKELDIIKTKKRSS